MKLDPQMQKDKIQISPKLQSEDNYYAKYKRQIFHPKCQIEDIIKIFWNGS